MTTKKTLLLFFSSLTPYGYTTALTPDYSVQKAAGDIFASAVKSVYGEIFTVGSTANLLCKNILFS